MFARLSPKKQKCVTAIEQRLKSKERPRLSVIAKALASMAIRRQALASNEQTCVSNSPHLQVGVWHCVKHQQFLIRRDVRDLVQSKSSLGSAWCLGATGIVPSCSDGLSSTFQSRRLSPRSRRARASDRRPLLARCRIERSREEPSPAPHGPRSPQRGARQLPPQHQSKGAARGATPIASGRTASPNAIAA